MHRQSIDEAPIGWRKWTRRPTPEVDERLLMRREEPPRFVVGVGDNDIDAEHDARTIEELRPAESLTVDRNGIHQECRREMRGEGVRQTQFGRELRAVEARS